jgi:hypothetical protein
MARTPISSTTGRMFSMLMKKTGTACFLLISIVLTATGSRADGVSAVKACEDDTSPPEEIARLTILPNGESRGSDTAATLIRMAKQKAKEGKDAEAIQWAALCNFFEPSEQEAIRRDSTSVLQYLKK